MEEEDNIIVKWAQEDVETSYNLLNNNNNNNNNMKLVTNKFKSGGLHEKHVVATWNLRNHLSVCL